MSFSYTPTPGQKESLHDIFRQLHAWREQNQDAASLQTNIAQRRKLVEEADPARWVKAGDVVDAFSVQEVDGATLTLDGLLDQGPLVSEKLVAIKRRHELGFLVASDLDNALGRRFGILYGPDEATQHAALARGKSTAETTGASTWELPQPTVVVIDHSV